MTQYKDTWWSRLQDWIGWWTDPDARRSFAADQFDNFPPPTERLSWWDQIAAYPDVMGVLIDWCRVNCRYSFYLGLEANSHGIVVTDTDSPLLVIGPPGGGKCIHSEMEIVNPLTGLIHTIEEVINKPELSHVLTLGDHLRHVEAVPITDKIDSGWKPTLKITTASGREMITTRHHPYLTPSGWVRADELKLDQTIALVHRIPEPLNPVPMDLEEIDVLGAMLTNGNFTEGGYNFRISTTDPEIIRRMILAGLKYGFSVKREAGHSTSRPRCDYRLVGTISKREGDRLCPTAMRVLMERWGVPRGLSKNKVIPDCVFSLPNDQLARFIAVFWMSDGAVDKTKGIPILVMASEKMVRQIQHLLLRFGIQSGTKYFRAKNGPKYFDAWRLTVYDSRKFAEHIPMWGYKRRNLFVLKTRIANSNLGFPRVSPELEAEIRADAQAGIASGLWKKVWLIHPGRKRGTSDLIKRPGAIDGPLFRTFVNVYNLHEKYGWLADGDIWWDPIVSIEDAGERHVYDLTVEPTACFIAGDMVIHNTASVMAVNSILAPGFLLCISSRVDLYRATALVRGRMGTVYNFSAFGNKLPGATPLKFSPLIGCDDYTYARKVGYRWASFVDHSEAALAGSTKGHDHFRNRSAALLSPLLFVAAQTKRDMGWVYRTITSPRLVKTFADIHGELTDLDAAGVKGADWAASELAFLTTISPEERGSTLTTTANALRAYADPTVVEHSKDADADIAALVRGRPQERLDMYGLGDPVLAVNGIYARMVGSYDSVYICDVDAEDPTAFIYLDLQDRFREEMYEYSQRCEIAGKPRPMPLTWVNDEMAVAPPSRMGQSLAQQRDRGIKMVGALQSLAQAELIWGRIGEDFFSLWRTAIVFRGVKDLKTINLLATLSAKYWAQVGNSSTSTSNQGPSSSEGVGFQRMDTLEPDQIAKGHPHWPDGALVLPTNARHFWIRSTPYFDGEPWPRVLINSAEKALAKPNNLPLPPLAKDDDYSHLEALGLAERFKAIQNKHFQEA